MKAPIRRNSNLKRALCFVCAIIVAGCSPVSREKGTLSGHVTIGPLQPVVREGETEPTPSPEVYAAWQIVVYSEDKRQEIARADIDPAGDYQITLPVSTYVVTAEPLSGGRGPGGSKAYDVEITRGRATHLDVDIDTGIR
jgi:hypothetical protein